MRSAICKSAVAVFVTVACSLIGLQLAAAQDKKDKAASAVQSAKDKAALTVQDKKDKAESTAQDKKDDKKSAASASFEMYKDKAGEYRFRLNDAKGNLLAIAGKGYEKKADCQAVIDAIKRDAAKAKFDDQTAKELNK